ncbi:MAG: hypothetical protein D3910_07360, partial [Candidatus Electrothrix sp. ATG2]|nr:hypothetical protein [Candidatus Electrothrix sp. ATG2]
MNPFITAAPKTAQHSLSLCGSGNLSNRKDEHHMLISASNFCLSDITEEQIATTPACSAKKQLKLSKGKQQHRT